MRLPRQLSQPDKAMNGEENMKTKLLIAVVIIFSLLAPPAPALATAPSEPFLPPVRPDVFPPAPGAKQDEQGRWYMPAEAQAALGAQQVSAQSTGGPDAFGYTWTDAELYNWINASGGTNINVAGGGSGAIALPFPFKFYENTYNSVYVSQYGYLTFTQPNFWVPQSLLVDSGDPNNIIAPYWAPTIVSVSGYVKSLFGGTAPNRYVVVEWNALNDSHGNLFTYQSILHENGDIVFQYKEMISNSSKSSCATAGIEDSSGEDGLASLAFCDWPFNLDTDPGNAIRFVRPAPSARVKVLPPLQGQFTQPGAESSFLVNVTNTGELGNDSYNISVSSVWDAAVYEQTGTTEITNTGSIAQGVQITVMIKVTTPPNAVIGDDDEAAITFTSTTDNTKQRTVHVRTAVPARFAQAYQDWDVDNTSLGLYTPGDRRYVNLGPGGSGFVNESAIITLPSGHVFQAWSEWADNGNAVYYDIWYTIVNPKTGVPVVLPSRLTNNSATTTYTYNGYIALALTPNGRIGITWIRYVYSNSEYVSNILFAALNTSGGITKSPTNLTGNTAGSGLSYREPTISATSDNRFAVAWEKYASAGPTRDVYYALYDSGGAQVVTPTRLFFGMPGDNETPRLVTLNASQTLLVWNYNDNLFYTTLSSAGIRGSLRQLTSDVVVDYAADGVQLPDGRVALGWVSFSGVPSVRFAVLDPAFNVAVSPVTLNDPLIADPFISVTTDTAGRIILTWLGGANWEYLLYTLANPDGTVLTQPTIFENLGINSRVSPLGHGNAPFPVVTFTDVFTSYWAWRHIESIYAAGITTGCGNNSYCPGTIVTRDQMAVFLMRGIKGTGYVLPPVGDSTGFADVPTSHWAAAWIKQFRVEGITSGCGGGNYCPSNPVTRDQMAVFLLRAKYGALYLPPPVGGSTGFADVPASHWAAAWIKQLAIEGITTGCGGGNFCPGTPVSRDQMAVFLQRTFNLPLP